MDRVNGANTVDIGEGRRGFRSQNAAAGIAGTEVTSKFMNDVQEEICKVISEAGIELDPESQQQLYEALLAISAPGYGNRSPWLPVISMAVTAPPNDAVVGDTYCIPAGATGAWAGESQDIAEWTGSSWRIFTAKDGHGIGLPDGRVFIRIGGVYVEWLASRQWVFARKTPIGQLNSLPWLTVKSITLAAPPANPSEGDLYIIATGASGAWAGKVGQLAEWSEAAWRFSVPSDGHGVSLPDGRVFERVGGSYTEKLALDAQSGKWSFANAGGSANALTATLTPAPDGLQAGLSIVLFVATSNTAAATLNLNGLGAKSILTRVGDAVKAGDVSGMLRLVYDGAAWRLSSVAPSEAVQGQQIFTSSGTFTVPSGVYSVIVRVWAGGGGGGGTGSIGNGSAGGGGAGGFCMKRAAVVPGQSITVTVGSAGMAGGGGGGGGPGGTSSFGSICSAIGGGGGQPNNSSPDGGSGGTATGGDMNISGGAGGSGVGGAANATGGFGGGAPMGGPGGSSGQGASSGGVSPGGGGGGRGTAASGNGGAGGGGLVIVEW